MELWHSRIQWCEASLIHDGVAATRILWRLSFPSRLVLVAGRNLMTQNRRCVLHLLTTIGERVKLSQLSTVKW